MPVKVTNFAFKIFLPETGIAGCFFSRNSILVVGDAEVPEAHHHREELVTGPVSREAGEVFVEHVVEDNDSQAIVSSITRLADALGMASTAEGIETREQLDLLRKLGCQEAQGFLICKPAPAETFATPEAVEAALTDHGPDVVDYRKAREAVLRKREGRVA